MKGLVGMVVLFLAAGSAFAAEEAGQGGGAGGSAGAFSWSGFYVGGNVAYGHNHHSSTTTNTANGVTTDTSSGSTGVIGGGQVGFNIKTGSPWVVGVEGDVNGSSLNETFLGYNAAGVNTASTATKTKAIGTVRGGVGYGWGRILLDAKGGLAWHDINGSRTQIVGRLNNAPAGTVEDTSYTSAGWTAGGGFHVGLVHHWAAQGEYLYLHFTHDNTTPLSMLSTSTSGHLHVVRFGVNYMFN